MSGVSIEVIGRCHTKIRIKRRGKKCLKAENLPLQVIQMAERNADYRNLTSFSSSDSCVGSYIFTKSALYFTSLCSLGATLSSDNNELAPSLLNQHPPCKVETKKKNRPDKPVKAFLWHF